MIKIENEKIDVIREIMIYFSKTPKCWKKIDQLYDKYYDKCVGVREQVDERVKELDLKLENTSIEIAYYTRRFISLIILDELSNSTDNIVEIISYAFKKPYNYAISCSYIKLSSYCKKRILEVDDVDEMLAQMLAIIFMAYLYGKKIDEDDVIFVHMMYCFDTLKDKSNGSVKRNYSYQNCTKKMKALVNELELIIRSKYFTTGYNALGLHEFLEVKECFTNGEVMVDKIKDDICCKISCAIEYADNILNKGESLSVLKGIEIKKDLVKDFINTYLIFSGYNTEEDIIIDKNDINLEELCIFLSVAISQSLYLESYGNAHKFFFDNYSEQMNIKYKELVDKEEDLRSHHTVVLDENEKLRLENEELRRKLIKMENALNKSQSNNKELFELRNYLFNNQEEYDDEVCVSKDDEIDLEYLNDKRVICFGGNKAWVSNMSKEFTNWTFIAAQSMNFDASILKDADIVFIKATYISHGMYYKVMANLNDKTEIRFINNTNINRIKKELGNIAT